MKASNWEKTDHLPIVTSCKQAARLVSLSFERPLKFYELLVMRLHLMNCKTCSFYYRQIKALRSIFIRHHEVLDNTPSGVDERLDEGAKNRIKESITSRF